MILMGGLAALCLLLMFPLSSSQNTFQSEQEISPHQGPAAPPPPPPNIRELLIRANSPHLNADRTCKSHLTSRYLHRSAQWVHVCLSDGPGDKDNAKIFLFIAASVGTFALMAAVYCIYNKFYTKHQYLHTQLNDDPGLASRSRRRKFIYFYFFSAGETFWLLCLQTQTPWNLLCTFTPLLTPAQLVCRSLVTARSQTLRPLFLFPPVCPLLRLPCPSLPSSCPLAPSEPSLLRIWKRIASDV